MYKMVYVKGGKTKTKNEDGMLATVSWVLGSTACPNSMRTYKDV